MRSYVFTDGNLERYAGRFVWLSVNTEDKKNADFLKRYPIPALPTMLVLDAKNDKVTTRYVGGATVPQLRKLLDESEQKYRARSLSDADKLLAEADRAGSEGREEEAAKLFEKALAAAPTGWKGYGRAAESLVYSLSMGDNAELCASRAAELYQRVRGTTSSANVASTGLSCATQLPEDNARRKSLLSTLEAQTNEVFDNPNLSLSADDRSGLFISLIDARDAAGDGQGALRLKMLWVGFLEDAASRATTPEQRAVYDSHRLSAYMDLGTPEKAIPMLQQSEKDFPDDYNPPSRLALAYKQMKQYDLALEASNRAMSRVYGPRKLTVMAARADIYTAMGNNAAAKETIAQAVAYAKSLPEGQRSERRIAGLEKKLATLNSEH